MRVSIRSSRNSSSIEAGRSSGCRPYATETCTPAALSRRAISPCTTRADRGSTTIVTLAHRRRGHAHRDRRPFIAPDWGSRQQGSPSTCLQTPLESNPHSGRPSRRPSSALPARASARSASRAARRRAAAGRPRRRMRPCRSHRRTARRAHPPRRSTSRRTSRSLATTGTPACAASTTARPKVSARVGKTNTSRLLRNCATRSGLSSPAK